MKVVTSARSLIERAVVRRGVMPKTIPFLGVVVLVLALGPPASSAPSPGTLIISSNTTLTANHYGSVEIVADNVTLDCARFRIIGPSADPWPVDGVLVDHHSGATIKNCVAQGFVNGFNLQGVTGSTLVGNTATANQEDGFFEGNGSTGNMFRNNASLSNGGNGFDVSSSNTTFSTNRAVGNQKTGWSVVGAIGLLMTGNQASGNAHVGFGVHLSSDMTWSGNSSIRNGETGFDLAEASSGNTLDSSLATGNGGPGFVLEAPQNLLTNNVSRANAGSGFDVFDGSSGNELRGNLSVGNGAYGFALWPGSTGTTLATNQATGNTYEGLAVLSSSYNELLGNSSQGNTAEGISLYYGADYNVVRANVVTRNTNSGIILVGSSHNSITDNQSTLNNWNTLRDNGGGISVVEGSTSNDILRNTACRNGHFDGYDDHSGTNNWQSNKLCTSSI